MIAGRPIPVPSIPKSQPSDMFGLLTQDEIMNFIKAGGPDGKGPRYHELSIAEIQMRFSILFMQQNGLKLKF